MSGGQPRDAVPTPPTRRPKPKGEEREPSRHAASAARRVLGPRIRRIEPESHGLRCPCPADALAGGGPAERLRSAGDVAGRPDLRETAPRPLAAFAAMPTDRCVLDRAVHAPERAVGSRAARPARPGLDLAFAADASEAAGGGEHVPPTVGDLRAVAREPGADAAGRGLDRISEALRRGRLARLGDEADDAEPAGGRGPPAGGARPRRCAAPRRRRGDGRSGGA